MLQSQVRVRVRSVVAALASSVMLTGILVGAAQSPAAAAVTSVTGSACSYYVNVGLFGGPQTYKGCGSGVATTDASFSPKVDLPSGGGSVSQDDATCPPSTPCSPGAKAQYGPAVIHGGIWPADVAAATASGPQHASTSGTTGAGGSVTSSASITLDALPYPQVTCTSGFSPPPGNTGCNDPGGFGPPPVWGDSLLATCTANESGVTGSATFSNAFLAKATDSGGSPLPSATESIPNNPPPNYTKSGVITNVGDVFTVVFNQQIVHPDKSLTVNAVHMYLFGPTAVGELVRGSVTCGTNPSAATSTDTVAPTCGTLVVEPNGPDDPTPQVPRKELVGVFDAGTGAAPTGVSISNVTATNGTVAVGAQPPSSFAYLNYTPGMVGPLPVTATRTDENQPMTWSFDATDQAGHTVHCGNPVGAGADNYTTAMDTPLTVAAPGVLANDVDANSLALTAGSPSTPAHGSVALNADGSFTYTPTAGYAGPDSFTYVASDSTGGSSTGMVNITVVNTAPPSFAVNDISVVEGDSGTTPANFTVTRTGDSTTTVKVHVADTNGTATVAGNDYTPTVARDITFGPGVTSQTVSATVNGDTIPEANETFNLILSRPSVGATIADSKGVATIVNDDVVPTLSVNDISVTEGDEGTTTPANFTITRSGNTTGSSTVKYKTVNGTATTAGLDYAAIPAKTLTFAPNETTKTVTATVKGDFNYEADETFKLVLFAPTIATITDDTGIATIVNDDAQPLLSVNDVSANEGNSGLTPFVFTITRSGNTLGTTTVKWKTAAGTALSSDFIAVPNTTVTFGPGVSTVQVTVNVKGDTTVEPNETFSVVLSAPTLGAAISDGTGTGTILNDDGP